MPIIIADKYIEHLCEVLGIEYAKTRRIIIDAQAGSPVFLYVEMLGTDETLLMLHPPEVLRAEVRSPRRRSRGTSTRSLEERSKAGKETA